MTDDENSNKRKRGGSRQGKQRNINRRRELYGKLLFEDYWGENPLYQLEAITDHNRWFWHFYFGSPGALNVLDRSTLHDYARNGVTPIVKYVANEESYTIPYWLANGIYPPHHCFVKTISFPSNENERLFARKQEEKRKNIECAFEILQARFHILTIPCRLF
jgi:hypothetical protein